MSGSAARNGFLRETLPQLIERAQADIEANLPGSVARLPQSNLDALAVMSAGMADEQLEGIGYYAEQIHVTTATGLGLQRHGSEWGIFYRDATFAEGELAVPLAANTTVPSGSLFQTATRWQVRTTAVGATVAPGVVLIPARALETGPAGNLIAGTVLDTVNPIGGVLPGTIVGGLGFAGGNREEGQEAYRRRILDRIQQPPQGGATYDYRNWMMQFPGCTRAWVYPKEQGIGTVVCRFMMDDTYPPPPNVQPGDPLVPAAEVARMAQWLDVRRPVTAEVFVYAPIALPVDVIVRDLFPNTPAVQQAVDDEMRDMLTREGEPGGMLYRSWFWEAASIASGERHHVIDAPAADVQPLPGELGVLGVLTFVFTP